MLSFSLKFSIILFFLSVSASLLRAADTLQSTSPDHEVSATIQDEIVRRVAASESVITFSEFPQGTAITDQYADKGIIFSGDNPFITGDGSNPTSPVLSGSPTFEGAIEGRFVDPATGEPTTVSHFELDAGYFNNLSSTKLQWFDSNGDLIREVFDSILGIEHFSVDDDGIASFRIEIVSQEDAGYAIDNVSFTPREISFDHEFELDKITHTAKSNVANTFSIYFKSLEAKNDADPSDVCDKTKYSFFVEDEKQKLESASCSLNSDKTSFKIGYTVDTLEDAVVSICQISTDECKTINDIKNFSVYLTNFDVSKDGFSYKNGDWNEFMLTQNKEVSLSSALCWKYDLCTSAQLEYTGSMVKLVNSFKEFMKDSHKEKAVDLIGYYKIKDYSEGYDSRDREFGGVCHGLAISAIANFNNQSEASAWGNSLTLSQSKDDIVSTFQDHWDDKLSESAKPFSKDVYSFSNTEISDAFHGLGKIGYYFLAQSSYSGGNAWVGTHEREIFESIEKMNEYYQNLFSENKVGSLRFTLSGGGHSIVAAGLIKYNSHSVYVLHDNNFVDTLVMLDFEGTSLKLTKFIYDIYATGDVYDQYGDFKLNDQYGSSSYTQFGSYTEKTDELYVYGKPEAEARFGERTQYRISETVEHSYPNHSSVTIVGGKLLKITNFQTNEMISLIPENGVLNANKAYLKGGDIHVEFLLPKASTYSIEIQKYKQYPGFDVYAKVPDESGGVNVINYEGLATKSDDATKATFLIGMVNTDKEMKREGEGSLSPSYDQTLTMEITPVTFTKASRTDAGVSISWNLPVNGSLDKVVLVRKEGSKPASITDGSQIYEGLDESFIDSTASSNKQYYYVIYAVSSNQDIAEGDFVYLDTHQATLSGVINNGGLAISGVEVTLKNGVGTVKKVISSDFSDKNGYFSFRNLPLGTYLVEFTHDSYKFESSQTVKLESSSHELTQEGVAIPSLSISVDEALTSGEVVSISWNGINVEDSEEIDIEIYSDNIPESIASGERYDKHAVSWEVPVREGISKIRASLKANPSIFAEKDILVIVNDAPETPASSGGGGGISLPMLFLILIIVGMLPTRRRYIRFVS